MSIALLQDFRFAAKSLLRRPAFTLSTVVVLALCTAASTALFAVFQGVLLRPLPWPDSDGLVRVSEWHPGGQSPIPQPVLSNLAATAWGAAPSTVEGIAAWSTGTYSVDRGGEQVRVAGVAVSPTLFSLLRIEPDAGRVFDASDVKQTEDVVVLTSSLATEWFGDGESAVGKTLRIEGRPHLVLGVIASSLAYPDPSIRLFTPFVISPVQDGGMSVFAALARLRPETPEQQAAAEGTAAARSLPRPMVADLLLGKGQPVEVRVRSLRHDITASVRPALEIVGLGVGLLLAMGCGNVANLLLSRSAVRRRDLAVQAALGASRGRLVRQLLAEAALMAATASAAGLALGAGVVYSLPALLPSDFPRAEEIAFDARVAVFAIVAGVGSALLATVAPALAASKRDVVEALRDGGRSATQATGGLARTLLVAEAAMSMILLVGAGLTARSLSRLLSVDPGYDADDVLMARIVFPENSAESRRATSLASVLDRLRARPELAAVGAGSMAPFVRFNALATSALPWSGPDGQRVTARVRYNPVTPGYAEALSLRLREGRLIEPTDGQTSPRPIVVSESFVRSYVHDGRTALGRQMRGAFSEEDVVSEIVGVVGDVLKEGLDATPHPEIYVPLGTQDPGVEVSLVVRTRSGAADFGPTLRSIVRDADPTLALDGVSPLAREVAASMAQRRLTAGLLAALGAVAVVLSATGLFAVLSFWVALRRREIGIRAAVGARGRELAFLVVGQGLLPTTIGVGLGLGGCLVFGGAVAPLLFGVTPTDQSTLAAACLVVVAVAAAACGIPARRAAATDPAEVLRSQ